MNKKKAKHNDGNDGDEKIVELRIAGHSVTLSFAAEPDAAAAQRVRNCLIDSYIRQNAVGHRVA
ncbi:MAG: hypothetical protein K2O84_09850 [Oscillospiraceae bacterium]|nr:hypothetical protein [Oscillospiraceae bacterium]